MTISNKVPFSQTFLRTSVKRMLREEDLSTNFRKEKTSASENGISYCKRILISRTRLMAITYSFKELGSSTN